MSAEDRQPWHVDKRIPLALIGVIILQTFGMGWWASSISERVVSLENWRADSKNLAADIAVIKNEIANVRASQTRLESRLDGMPKREQQNFLRPDEYRPLQK